MADVDLIASGNIMTTCIGSIGGRMVNGSDSDCKHAYNGNLDNFFGGWSESDGGTPWLELTITLSPSVYLHHIYMNYGWYGYSGPQYWKTVKLWNKITGLWTEINTPGLIVYGQNHIFKHHWATIATGPWYNISKIYIYMKVFSKDNTVDVGIFDLQLWGQYYRDIGLRYYDGSNVKKIGVEDLDGHKLRVYDGSEVCGIDLIAPDRDDASKIRIHDGSVIKSLPEID